MANRQVISRVKDLCDEKHIEYETNYITFSHNGLSYQVFRLGHDKGKYRLNIIKGKKCISEDFGTARFRDLLRKIKDGIEGNLNDDFND